ncbi:hypothetical protein [Paraburkholderia sp. RL17-373-BIF-A]|uniref:hypothetical protein n=1 Tax=Paraburkholderia sp. RL17-373-BIF-A TaxID=3031629 RepID=UPI0038BAB81D
MNREQYANDPMVTVFEPIHIRKQAGMFANRRSRNQEAILATCGETARMQALDP